MNKNLFDSDDNSDEDDFEIKTNENYAKYYNNLRKKELLQKFRDKELELSESNSEDSDSSEEDEVLDPSFDQEFLKTLASLKSRDPAIYDKNTKFFKNTDSENDTDEYIKSTKKKTKPITLKDYERNIILENGGKFKDDSDETNCEEENIKRPISPSAVEEELLLKAEFKKALNQIDDLKDEEFGGIFKKREKSKAEKDKEEEDYLKWLAGKKETIEENVKEKLEPLKNYWNSDKLPSSERFLRDYILNKGYTEATNYNEIPTYEEIVGDNVILSEDEQELEKQAEFEHKYNFRYEDPDQEFIKRYPRTIQGTLRTTNDKRKKKRQELKERKLKEKQQKLKELEMVKEMKRREIQEKIEKLKMVTGNDELGFKDDDLEEDFDPDVHDRRMRELFNDEYYQVDEGEEKPECPPDIDELRVEDWDNFDPQQDGESYDYVDYEPHCEDQDFNMDCDYDPANAKEELQNELIENTKRRRRGRKGRRDRFIEIIKAEKPVFDPNDEKTYGEYIDEYYKLDCEDIIGDIPCRFKYVETTPNDFGLTIEEILLAKNKELNQWASLKKAIQLRPEQVEKKEQRLYKLKAKNCELKRKIFKSLYGESSDEEEEVKQIKAQPSFETDTKISINNGTSGQKESINVKKKKKPNSYVVHTASISGELKHSNVSCSMENKQNIRETTVETTKVTNRTTISEISVTNQPNESQKKVITRKDNINKKKTQDDNQKQIHTDNCNTLNINTETKTFDCDVGYKNQFGKVGFHGVLENRNSKTYNKSNNAKQKSNSLSKNKNNPFDKGCTSKESAGLLPPLRKQMSKSKLNEKCRSDKFNLKKRFITKFNHTTDGTDISDERLKAYGINPKKFYRKQKFVNGKKNYNSKNK